MRTVGLILWVALATTACAKKPASPAASPGASAPGATSATAFQAAHLGLNLVAALESDPLVPGAASFQGGVAALDPAYLEGEIMLRNTIHVTSVANGPFLTWPAGTGKGRIDVAHFAVRNHGTDNRMGGEPRFNVAAFDRDGQRFFIPLKDALSRRLQDLGPSDEQIVGIRLHPAEGKVIELTLRFRVAGPLTAIQAVKDEQLAPAIAGSSFIQSGVLIPLRRVTFQNPTLRSVALWLKPVSEDLLFIGRFHHLRTPGHGGDPELQRLNWNSRMQMSRVTVFQRGGGRAVAYRGSAAGWMPIHFGPGEQVAVEWAAVSRGCGGTRGEIVGVSAEGSWEMETWITDDSHPAVPDEFQSLPSFLSMSTGRIASSARVRTGNWDGFVSGAGTICR